MIAAPPLNEGAVNETFALVWPDPDARTLVGAFGKVGEVVIKLEAADGADTPVLLVAVTVKV